MKTIFPILLSLLSLIFLSACEDVVELSVPDSPPHLVVEGSITNHRAIQQVKLTWSTPYFDQGTPPPVEDARVELRDDLGNIYAYSPEAKGLYALSLKGEVGRTYRLSIFLPNGQEFHSTPETLLPVSEIQNLKAEVADVEESPDEEGYQEYKVLLTAIEPQDEINFYRWKVYINDTLQNEPDDLAFARDDFVNEQVRDVDIYWDDLRPGDRVCVEQMSITEAYYDFLNILYQQTAFTGGLFDPPPAPIRGNITLASDESIYALGYFNASAVDSDCLVVE